jgi:hypothetical protein
MKIQSAEICYNVVNSLIAAGLVFLGAVAAGNLDWNAIYAAGVAATVVFLLKFQKYWEGEESQYSNKKGGLGSILSFVG